MSLDAELCGDKRIKGLARKLVRRIAGEGPLPSEIEVPATPEEWEAIAEVGRILGVAAYQKGRKAVFRIPPERRDPAGWESVCAVFAKKELASDPGEEAFRRARLIADVDVVEPLKSDATVVRSIGCRYSRRQQIAAYRNAARGVRARPLCRCRNGCG